MLLLASGMPEGGFPWKGSVACQDPFGPLAGGYYGVTDTRLPVRQGGSRGGVREGGGGLFSLPLACVS